MSKFQSLRPAMTFFALVTAVAFLLGSLLTDANTVLAEDPAPDYSAELLHDGGEVELSDYEGEVVLLNIWATWCEPCKREMPVLSDLDTEYAEEDFHVLGVSIDRTQSDEEIQAFADEHGADFTLLKDPSNDITRAFRASGVPESFLIDRAGNVAYQWRGEMVEENAAEDREVIEAALASTGAADTSGLGTAVSIGFFAAFAAGLLSVLSPCVLPLLPTYATYITGVSVNEMASQSADQRSQRQRTAFKNGLIFIAGFSLVFIALGASASAVGGLFHDYRIWIARIGGVVLLAFGLHLLNIFRIPLLDRVVRLDVGARPANSAGTFAVGIAFGAGWTPCIGPALASILTIAAATASAMQGMALLTVYSLGFAIPFLAGTVLIDRFMKHRSAMGTWLPRIERTSGVLIIAIGLLMVTGMFEILASWFSQFDTLV